LGREPTLLLEEDTIQEFMHVEPEDGAETTAVDSDSHMADPGPMDIPAPSSSGFATHPTNVLSAVVKRNASFYISSTKASGTISSGEESGPSSMFTGTDYSDISRPEAPAASISSGRGIYRGKGQGRLRIPNMS